MTSAPASTLRSTGLVVLDGSDGLVTVLSGLLHRSGMRLEIGQTAADGVDLALRAGDPDAIPDLVVLSGPDATATERWATWRALGIPHVLVEHDRRHVSIGPVVVPGSTCLRCVTLHRQDAWRLAPPAHRARRLTTYERTPDDVLVTLGAGVTAMLARNLVLHRRYLPDLSFEIRPPDPRIVPRSWSPHPRCDGHDLGVTMGL
ncbi:MAG: hypothetical protein M9891_10970 [Austwickia sp.]|nr:hypothetical protein [Actinomycetota bacterium]MCO5309792.1 hypothetical protein [Austwickia sp.]